MPASAERYDRAILFAVMEYGELPELVRTAELLKELGREITFYFVKPGYRQLEIDGALVAARGFRWLSCDGSEGRAAADSGAASETAGSAIVARPSATSHGDHASWRIWRAVMTASLAAALGGPKKAKAAVVDVINLRADLARFKDRHATIARVLARERPALVVLGQSACGSELDMVIEACGRTSVPTLIVPFAMFNKEELVSFARGRTDHRLAGRPLNQVAATLFPRWLHESGGDALLRLPGPRALALELGGLVCGDPWVPCSAPVDAIACESRIAAAQLESMGLAPNRLHVVGGPVHDRLTALVAGGKDERRRLASEHGLDPERPLLACGWPANIFPWLGDRTIAFRDYEEISNAWTEILTGIRNTHGVGVIVSAHPKTLDEEVAKPRAAGLPVVRGGTERLIAACDFFTTLNGSSVTAWAIACARPTVLFDCYQTRYPEFASVPGLVMTEQRDAFEAALIRVCSDPAFASGLVRDMRGVAADWGALDGRSCERLVELARQLIHGRSPAASDRLIAAA